MLLRRPIAAAVLVLGLSACSGPDPVAAPPVPPPASSAHDHHHMHHSAVPVPSGGPGGTVVVHAADQLRPTLDQLVPKFEEAFPGIRVAVDYGAGTEHVRHIAEGAPIDVFVASDAATASLVGTGHVRGEPAVVARNPIVIAVPREPRRDIAAVTDLSGARVALCAPVTPCGKSGRAALDAAAVDVREESVEADPATALTRVRAGSADAALVHRTDVVAAGDDLTSLDFTQALRMADEYTAIRPTTGVNKVGADAFVSFLSSSLARHMFADVGLSPA